MKTERALTVLIVLSGLLALLAGPCPGWVGGRVSSNDPLPMNPVIHPPGKEVTILFRRLKIKYLVVQRLHAGELTLVEAAAVFQHLNTTPAELPNHTWRRFPGADDGERVCRQVIHSAKDDWSDHCTKAELKARLDRLEQELREHIAAHGGVTLPTNVPDE